MTQIWTWVRIPLKATFFFGRLVTIPPVQVYGEEFPLEGEFDRRKALLASLQERTKERQSTERRRTSGLLR